MNLRKILTGTAIVLVMVLGLTSCNKDKKRTENFSYSFNTGQVAAAFAYSGTHSSSLSADLKLEGQKDGTMITVTLNNTVSGETYNIHAHDVADASTTPNGTPYNESPNTTVFVQQIMGNGGSANASQLTTMTVTELTETYEGFFVVHDPLQTLSTVDPTTYVLLASFAR